MLKSRMNFLHQDEENSLPPELRMSMQPVLIITSNDDNHDDEEIESGWINTLDEQFKQFKL